MGSGKFAQDLNCYQKKRLGWLTDKEITVIKYKQFRRFSLVNALGFRRGKKRCVVIQLEKPAIIDDSGKEYSELFLEFRSTDDKFKSASKPDEYLKWLSDGSKYHELKNYSTEPKIDTEGVLIRAVGGDDTDTVLFDAHPAEAFISTGRHLDSFLTIKDDALTIGAPFDV